MALATGLEAAVAAEDAFAICLNAAAEKPTDGTATWVAAVLAPAAANTAEAFAPAATLVAAAFAPAATWVAAVFAPAAANTAAAFAPADAASTDK